MEMELQVSLDSEVQLHKEDTSLQDADPGVTLCTPEHVEPQQPAKKPTRQWAAWTRQEEESFFTALRQVGKNFEKITRRVQSKNKDQVRHYYYRLVRRMNKLLGPGLCLDAKNSKDTNAAMLRWWSLLEKYSCKASKLHLKPRRFKIFIEALENQLLKDRKKNVRRRPLQVENCSPTAPSTVPNQNRASGHDTRTVKLVLMDSQNIQKLSTGKGSLKRNANMGIVRGNSKGESTTTKPLRQRRKQGVVSSAAYKKWEKAAMAGVSLVADAAEHLERTATDKEVEQDQGTTGQQSLDPVEKVLPPLPPSSQNYYLESQSAANMKLKLQLFPIDDGTRRALEMDNHNPHLELTLSTRKRISSILEHLNRKWGTSIAASGELMLFPYSVQRENLMGCQRWTQDSIVSAADVCALIGSPPVFRLRYGWFSNTEFGSTPLCASSASSCIPGGEIAGLESSKGKRVDFVPTSVSAANDQSDELVNPCKNQLNALNKNHSPVPPPTNMTSEIIKYGASGLRNDHVQSSDHSITMSWQGKDGDDGNSMKQLEHVDDMRLRNVTSPSSGEWADSLTDICVGDLLAEVPHDGNANCFDTPISETDQCFQQTPFSCESFDAAIAAHISRHQNKMGFPPILTSHTSSIWDAEETCDAFSFPKNHALCREVSSPCIASPGSNKRMARASETASVEELPGVDGPAEYHADKDPTDECPSDPQLDTSAKDFSGLADIYWPESLGPLDLDAPMIKYHSEDLILSDSLSGLNRLIASSLDAFQNCSFFGLDKKDSTPTVEARETISFSDFKTGRGV